MKIRRVVAAATALALLAAVGAWFLRSHSTEGRMATGSAWISVADLTRAAGARVFFGHQSVGMNILNAVPALYQEHGLAAPPIVQDGSGPNPGEGFIEHSFIGRNEDPASKIADFAARLRANSGHVDVALMKFCYVDITTSTDVLALFRTYRDTLSALQREFPQTAFIAVTVPLTTEQGLGSQLKNRLSGSDRFSRQENAVRERLNALLRTKYAGRLFDLAGVESTAPDGTRSSGHVDGSPYYSLYRGYASDTGHLNAAGGRRAAAALLEAIASAYRK